MLEKERTVEIPAEQRMVRQKTIAREHTEEYRAALHRAVTLAIPHAFSSSAYGTFDETSGDAGEVSPATGESVREKESWGQLVDRLFERDGESGREKESWDPLIERLFEKDESGQMVLRRSAVHGALS